MKIPFRNSGLVLGKFLPLHAGHDFLIHFAKNYVKHLTLVIGIRPTDPIPGSMRIKWLKDTYPFAKIIAVDDINPEESHPEYWSIWERTLHKALGKHIPEFLFASEQYGFTLASRMGMTYIPVNHPKNLIQISATRIRQSPMANWKYIPPVVRPYYVKKICIFGPESTGKTTLTRGLATHYDTVYCDEYARGLLDLKNGEVVYSDIDLIARGHFASEVALQRHANRLLISDTDMLTTTIWSDIFYKKIPSWIAKMAPTLHYDLTILTDIDVPWVADPQRYFPNERISFYARCKQALENAHRPFITVSGSHDKRMKSAIKAIDEVLV